MDDFEFHRLKRLPPYVFAEVNAMKARARAAGQDVIDLGMGNPDLPTAPHIVAKLAEAAANPRAHGYSASRGIPGLRKAQAAYYARRFGVELDPESEIIVTLGSKEGLANLAQAITSPGDIVLVPNPSYPIHPYGFIIAGGSVRHIPVPGSTSLEEFLPALERAVRHTVPKPIALVLNYPSNPTAQVVDLDFYAAIWPPPFQPRLPVGVTGVNTAILLLSAVTMRFSLKSMRGGDLGRSIRCLTVTTALGAIFSRSGLRVAAADPFRPDGVEQRYGGLFYTLIGFHALHVAGGLIWLLAVFILAKRGRFRPTAHRPARPAVCIDLRCGAVADTLRFGLSVLN